MSYRIVEVRADGASNRGVAEFLSKFVEDGEHPMALPGDESASVWLQRMSWWWDENPFCDEQSPRGFVLETDEGLIVGFLGLIPLNYQVDIEIIPSLVTTSFFVKTGHRTAVMGMLAKVRRLSRDFQIVDGTPSPEMRVMLEKFGYHNTEERKQYLFPVRGGSWSASKILLQPFGLISSSPSLETDGYYVTGDPYQIETIPEIHDGKVRRQLTRDSLEWLSRVGTERRQFFGLCDQYGNLQACGIGIYKEKKGIKACRLMDYVDFTDDNTGVHRLLTFLTRKPLETPLESDTGLIVWSIINAVPPVNTFSFTRDSIVHYSLPDRWKEREKLSVPMDGDYALQ